MFWRFGGYASISTIDTLLEKPNVTLEEILDESELMQELKQPNTKLIEYLREDNVLKRLLDYVISPSLLEEEEEEEEEEEDGDDDDDDDDGDDGGVEEAERQADDGTKIVGDSKSKRPLGQAGSKQTPIASEHVAYSLTSDLDSEELANAEKSRLKYSFIASEVLSSTSWSIIEALMQNETYLQDFWQFVWRKAPLDSLQAGYFTKVNEILLDQKTEEMLAFFRSLHGIVPVMLQHIDNPMVMDLLLKIISLEKSDGGQGIVEWLRSQNFIPILLSYLSPKHSSSTQTSAGDFLKAIITISANAAQNDQLCIGPNSLTRQLVSEPCMETLISAMLQGGNLLTVGVGIVIEIIRKNNSDYDPETGSGPESPPTNHDPIYLGTLLRIFARHVPDFMQLILSTKHAVNVGGKYKQMERAQLDCAWGTKIEPLGFDRFKTCELMAELLHCSNMALLNEVGSEEYIRHRDAERERLRTEAASAHCDDESGFVHEATKDLVNGISSDCKPEDPAKPDTANTSEEDGFEDVASSGVLVDVMKDDSDGRSEVGGSKSGIALFMSIPPLVSKASMHDDFVDEPLTPPGNEAAFHKKTDRKSTLSPAQIHPNDPISPTASGLTDKVEGFKFDNENQIATEFQESLGTASINILPQQSSNTLTSDDQRYTIVSNDSPASLSPHPDDTPAPLFASKPAKPPTDMPATGSEVETVPETAAVTGRKADSVTPSVTMGDTQDQSGQHIQTSLDDQPVVGDYLKIMFIENKVVPTILSFFFRFPWNNFLHNVVYDIAQQAFNGNMDRGFSRALAIDLFETGRITEQVVEGQGSNDEAQTTKNMRLGYMGHLTLIAEEVVKFSERHPPDVLSSSVMEKVLDQDWIDYVERTLSETRERDNAILGGVRPDLSIGHRQAVLNAVSAVQGFAGSSALTNAGLNGAIPGSGFDGLDLMNQGSPSSGVFGYPTSGLSLLSGFGSSSDDEDEEMEDPEDSEGKKEVRAAADVISSDNKNAASDSAIQPIPLLPVPPSPLNVPPSRARRQLAARLALQKQHATGASAVTASEPEHAANSSPGTDDNTDHDNTVLDKNPFVISTSEDDGIGVAARINIGLSTLSSPFSFNTDASSSPPSFPHSGFARSNSYSSNSSDEDGDESTEDVGGKVRLPLDIDDEEPGEMSDLARAGAGLASTYSDDEDETLIGESLGYASFFGAAGYTSAHGSGMLGGDDLLLDPDGRTDSSDGEEDDGLVEILVPGRRST